MSLTSTDVRHVEFALARRGYDEQQVDAFLDQVIVAIEERDAELVAARQAVESRIAVESQSRTSVEASAQVAEAVDVLPSQPQGAVDLLSIAHRIAQEHVETAEADAAEIVAAARHEAEQLRADAEAQNRHIVVSLLRERASLEQQIAELKEVQQRSRSEVEAYLGRLIAAVRESETGFGSGLRALPAISA